VAHQDLLLPIVQGWRSKLALAAEHKADQFMKQANECMKFLVGPYADWLYRTKGKGDKQRGTAFDWEPDETDGGDMAAPSFRVTINKAAELRDLFGPAMYQQNPDRRVSPRKAFMPPISYLGDPNDPNTQAAYMAIMQSVSTSRAKDETIAALFDAYLNFTPAEMNLAAETRLTIDEALIMGAGVQWTEVFVHPSGLKCPCNSYDPIRNLLLDPDANRPEDCMWIARECVHPVWELEDEYGYARGTLTGNMESANRNADYKDDPFDPGLRSQGRTNDLMKYWKVWSKMGMGQRLEGALKKGMGDYGNALESLGNFCYLVITPHYPFPLNLPPWKLEESLQDESVVQSAVQWPTPYWLDKGAWPMTMLAFHRIGGRLWPQSHLQPALGELSFINWTYSLLMGKIRVVSRDILVMLRGLADEVKTSIKHGPDYSVVEIENLNQGIDKIVQWLQAPTFNTEIYKVLDMMMEMFEKRTGLSDLMYGQTEQAFRSAEEGKVKQANATVRPADMAQQVEAYSSELSRKEMACARWHITAEDVLPVLGPAGAWVWQEAVMTTPPEQLFHVFECRVETGSTRRPDRERDIDNLNKAMQNLFGPFFQYFQATGNPQQVNSLVAAWGKAVGLDTDKMLFQPLPVMPAPAPGQNPPAAAAPSGAGQPPSQAAA
jgi:hypothetical protein